MRLKQFITYCLLFGIAFAFSGCSVFNGNSAHKQVKCPKPKKNVSKKFSTKRKARPRPVLYGSGGTSASKAPIEKKEPVQTASVPPPPPPPEPEVLETPEPDEPDEPVYEIVQVEEETVPTIAESKDTSFPDEPVTVVEFRGEEIDLKENEFKYDEPIEFIDVTDYFYSRDKAVDQIKDLAKLLKQNKDVELVIIGNTATTYPEEKTKYGGSESILDQEAVLNTEKVTIRDVMLARAGRVQELLAERGVPRNQMTIETGKHFPNKKQRVVTFLLRTKD